MKPLLPVCGTVFLSLAVFAGSLPTFTTQPTSQLAAPGSTATFSVAADGAIAYQWRFNGADIPSATSATLQVTNAQLANAGYYMAVAKNDTGWVPSQMAYLSVATSPGGRVALSNSWNVDAQASYFGMGGQSQPITNGSAQIVAGPALDQMSPVGTTALVTNGYFHSPVAEFVPAVAPGQTVYYRVDVTYTNLGGPLIARSTVLQLVAGSGSSTIPSTANLKFPLWPEWPEPWFFADSSTPTLQVRIPGESITFSNDFEGYGDYGVPTIQWRKDGNPVTAPLNFSGSKYFVYGSETEVLTLTNLQPSDAGIYDAVIIGNNWLVGPKINLSIQTANGQGFLRSPRVGPAGFICDLEGMAGRNYTVVSSTNLSDWNSLLTLSNLTGTVTFTNALSPAGHQFYRATLLP